LAAVAAVSLWVGPVLGQQDGGGDGGEEAGASNPFDSLDCLPLEPVGHLHADYAPPEGVTGAPATPADALQRHLREHHPALSSEDFRLVQQSDVTAVLALDDQLDRRIAAANVVSYADGWVLGSFTACSGLLQAFEDAAGGAL
jgi:hypothetical protein